MLFWSMSPLHHSLIIAEDRTASAEAAKGNIWFEKMHTLMPDKSLQGSLGSIIFGTFLLGISPYLRRGGLSCVHCVLVEFQWPACDCVPFCLQSSIRHLSGSEGGG